jgi:hypothetical protein
MYFYAEDKKDEESGGFILQFVKYRKSTNIRPPNAFPMRK